MVSAQAGRIHLNTGCVQLVLTEQPGRLQFLGQRLLAAVDHHVQGIVGDIGHLCPEERLTGQHLVLALGESAQLQSTGERGSVVVYAGGTVA